ncbi:MAG: hypothetical protein JWO73_561 [Candidatus Taylorbacteria bacterium]|nr:hypothetical protein [Candidatus Taylorbacteria bacterium]
MNETSFKPEAIGQPKVKDVRDYFPLTRFHREATEIDTDPSHPWGAVHNHETIKDDFGTIVVGECFESRDAPKGLLIAEKANDGESSSLYLDALDPLHADQVYELVTKLSVHLDHEKRHEFIRKVIEDAPKLEPGDVVAEKLGLDLLDLLPDLQEEEAVEESVCKHPIMEKFEDPKQREQFEDFILKVAQKMPEGLIQGKLDQMAEDTSFTHDLFGKNYPMFFNDSLAWVVKSREDTRADYELLRRQEPEKYAVKDMITNPVTTKAALSNVLSGMPIESLPDANRMQLGHPHAEIVELESVVGFIGEENPQGWEVSDSNGRGLDRIFDLAHEFQDGGRDVTESDPIQVTKVDGKYYISNDGRHRVAALKALGVKEAPMLVKEVVA